MRKKKKSPFFLDKSTGGLPKYHKQGNVLLNLNEQLQIRIQDLRKQLESKS
jgi:hypothetical protein